MIVRQWTNLQLLDKRPDGSQLLQTLLGAHRVDQDEGVPLRDGQPLHSRELMRSRGVRDLQRADVLVAAYDLCEDQRIM